MIENMNKQIRNQIIENDLGWAKKIKVTEIQGRLMLGDDVPGQLPYDVAHVMKEEEFVRKWMIPFAVGSGLGINYFNQAEWWAFSYGGTRSVLVVAQDPQTGEWKPVLNVPPIVQINLTDNDKANLRLAAGVMYANNEDASKKNDINANLIVANALADKNIGLEAPAMSFRDLIDPKFFEKWFIIPEVEYCTYYIRDVVRQGIETKPADLELARDILWRDNKGLQVTKAEYQFLVDFTQPNPNRLGPPTLPFPMDGREGVDEITDGGVTAYIKRQREQANKETLELPSKGQTAEKPESPFEC